MTPVGSQVRKTVKARVKAKAAACLLKLQPSRTLEWWWWGGGKEDRVVCVCLGVRVKAKAAAC